MGRIPIIFYQNALTFLYLVVYLLHPKQNIMKKCTSRRLTGFLLLAVTIFFTVSCSSQKDQAMDKKINVTGTAQNAKAGAVVVTTDNSVYYIEGMDSWSEEVLNTQVKVSGELHEVNHDEKDLVNEKGEYSQGMTGTQKIIRKAIVMKK
jgi:hypothetical protein